MARATSISLSKFTAAVQTAVEAAVQKHPKFKMETPTHLAVSYLIRGIPVPEAIAARASLEETRAFAAEVASHLSSSGQEGFTVAGKVAEAAVYAHGSHIIVGIPAVTDVLFEK